MDNFCKNCFSCCKLIPVDYGEQKILRDGLQNLDEAFFEQLLPLSIEEARCIDETYVEKVQKHFPNADFYKCRHISPQNICMNDNLHDYCIKYPSHPLAIAPDECNYYGELFIKSEELKQKIRRYKEEIIYYESMIASGCKDEKVYKKIITSLQRFIDKYLPFGSEDW